MEQNNDPIKRIRKRRQRRKRKKIISVLAVLAVLVLSAAIVIINHNSKGKESSNEQTTEAITQVPTAAPLSVATARPIEKPAAEPVPEPVPESEPASEPNQHRGTAEDIPDSIRMTMDGCSMPKNASITYDELSYLTIPHYDYSYNIVEGHMIVNKALAEEVLDIFAELFAKKYPIERMELVDKYGADDFLSIENNNTSAFNYRESTDGSGRLSKHALGRAIDINPQINPYVNSNGVGSHQNAREYWSRDISQWTSDVAKASYIGTDTDIYRIFIEHGWEWGGSWSGYRDYQHFQKSS